MTKRSLSLLLAAALAAAFLSACVSPDAESDTPWNATQPWEMSPYSGYFGH